MKKNFLSTTFLYENYINFENNNYLCKKKKKIIKKKKTNNSTEHVLARTDNAT